MKTQFQKAINLREFFINKRFVKKGIANLII